VLLVTEAVPKVLVVDDDPDNLRMVSRFLEAKGFSVVVTSSPFEVTRLLREQEPDVVVLDVMMPALDGEAVAKFIRGEWPEERPQILFYSAIDDERLQLLAGRVPGSTAVAKTAGLGALYGSIKELIASTSSQQ